MSQARPGAWWRQARADSSWKRGHEPSSQLASADQNQRIQLTKKARNMGLTISYSLGLTNASLEQTREKIISLHHQASQLPLMELGEVTELEGQACCFEEDDPRINLKYGALRLEDIAHNLEHRTNEIKASHLIGFDVFPGAGCSRSSFGLATYPEEPTSWQWHDHCKTQYATNPEQGGINNFIKSHISILKILESAQQLGILAEATDPSGYWENHDLEALVKNVTQQNILTAAVMGSLKDALQPLGYNADAPILYRADFEYLEAKGQDLLGLGANPQPPPDQP
jgi:hypothetical protein